MSSKRFLPVNVQKQGELREGSFTNDIPRAITAAPGTETWCENGSLALLEKCM